jgi:predicted Na+-dependent transporter
LPFYLVTLGVIVTIPSITLVLTPTGEVIRRSYNARPGVKFAVLAAVIERVISPFAIPVTVAVKLFAVDE